MAKKPKINQLLSKYNQQSRNGSSIKYIVIHYVGAISSAKNNCIYFRGGNRNASAHFFVDSQIWQCIPLSKAAWHCGGGLQDTGSRYVEGNHGATLHGKCINNNSIGIELCCKKDKRGRIVPSETAIETAIPLVKWLMDEYDVPASRVVRHFDVTGKCCLPLDTTEVLTPNGWKLMAELDEKDEIAQFNQVNSEISFTNFNFSVEEHFETVLKNRGLEATANHRMLTKPNSKNGVWKIRPWGEVLEGKKTHRILNAGYINNEGIDLTPEELRLLVWIQGDGSYMQGKSQQAEKFGIEWHLKKERKIEALEALLKDMEIEYSKSILTDGTVKIWIYSKKLINWAEQWLENKTFSYKFLSMTQEQFNIFWNELLIVDGCKSNGKESYTSAIEKNIDVVQSLCATHGTRTFKYYSNTCFFVSKVDSNYTTSGRERTGSPVEERETLVSCVEVPTGLILIRQKGKTFIVGNCPNGYVSAKAWRSLHARLTGLKVYPTKTLRKGMKNEQVGRLQICLNKIDKAGLVVDESYGPKVEKAVYRFKQKHMGVKNPNGKVVGSKCRAKIRELIK